ncbi:MAG TPA: ATP-binding protein [Gammaproteobacteria bacterium]|nr:ATP-binding protein [Gammaproteobacteria bacterium]
MNEKLFQLIHQDNPWLKNSTSLVISQEHYYIARFQIDSLLDAEWDHLWLILVGPRQAGKTTLGKHACSALLQKQRFKSLLYLNCDRLEIREWLKNSLFINEAITTFDLRQPILFIDEVQRLESPGLLLKTIVDLKLPIKLIASGSSQLEIKSKVQEFLTGRHIEFVILPLSNQELIAAHLPTNDTIIYGNYPAVIQSMHKDILLQQLYQQYIDKDIIEFLKIGKSDIVQKLITLLAHASGQLINYNQLAVDCGVSITAIKNYITILEKTYVIYSIKPFVGNKRSEITKNPIIYFIDNGFRNQALNNFLALESRIDAGLLVASAIFQELLKYKHQRFLNYTIHYWRTTSGAEVDFIIKINADNFVPIEVKYRHLKALTIPRSLRSFIEAYQPKIAIMITKDYIGQIKIDACTIHLLPLSHFNHCLDLISKFK